MTRFIANVVVVEKGVGRVRVDLLLGLVVDFTKLVLFVLVLE